jgi:ParB family transcriptional regulator, chromosome partitioning protein
MNRKPLGRGLSALISTAPSPQDNEELREIEIDLITPGEQQPRTSFDEAKLQELAQSIRVSGIMVRRRGGRFELVAGERRWRAAQLAGLSRVPAIVREIPDENLLELALIENIQRQELNAIEEANAYKRLIETLGLTQELHHQLPSDPQAANRDSNASRAGETDLRTRAGTPRSFGSSPAKEPRTEDLQEQLVR